MVPGAAPGWQAPRSCAPPGAPSPFGRHQSGLDGPKRQVPKAITKQSRYSINHLTNQAVQIKSVQFNSNQSINQIPSNHIIGLLIVQQLHSVAHSQTLGPAHRKFGDFDRLTVVFDLIWRQRWFGGVCFIGLFCMYVGGCRRDI